MFWLTSGRTLLVFLNPFRYVDIISVTPVDAKMSYGQQDHQSFPSSSSNFTATSSINFLPSNVKVTQSRL